MQQTDEQLVARLRLGDQEAFGEVYVRYWPRIYRFVLKLVGDPDQAKDTAQDVFVRAGKSLPTLQGAGSLRPWLFSIARNEVMQYFRKTRRNGRLSDDESPWTGETIQEGLERTESVEIVRQMITLLKPEYREVLLLREYEQLSYAEISSVTGDSESSVKSRLFKARKALLKRLEPYFGRV